MGNKFSRKGKKGGAASPVAGENKEDQTVRYAISVVATQGKELLAKDVGGTSDPFVVLEVDGQIAKSSTIKGTLTPVWNERLEVVVDAKPKSMWIKVYDWDRFTANDFIGQVEIPIPDKLWDTEDEVDYKWYSLATNKGKPAGQVELDLTVKKVTGSVDDDHSDAFFRSVTHFLRVTVKEAKNLKAQDLVTSNDAVVKVSFGSQSFSTKCVSGANPKWNQTAFFLVAQSRQKDFATLVEVYDKDFALINEKAARDPIGARYFQVADFFKAEEPVGFEFTQLYKFQAVKDNQLSHGSKAEDLNKAENVTGEISLEFEMITKSHAEKQVLNHLLAFINGGEDEKGADVVTRDAFETAVLMIDPTLGKEAIASLFKSVDKNADGELDNNEILKILNSAKFNNLGLAQRLLALATQKGSDQSAILNNIGIMQAEVKKKEGNVVMVKERESGLEVEENIPGYIKVAMQLMFANVVGRRFASKTVPMLERMSRLQGEKYSKPESANDIEHFIQLHNLNRDEFDKEVKEYKNFNEFFARGLRNQDVQRPLASPGDNKVAVCPADCRMTVFPELVDASRIWVKGDKFSLENLLGPAADPYADWFKGGTFVIARLAPQDYHRWHTPVAGTFGKRYPIAGALYTVNPIAINQPVNVYTENKRTVCLIDSEEFGAVILIAVAATMVGSMEIDGDEGAQCVRGATHGKFFFGGSTVLLLFQPGTIKLSEDLVLNTTQNPARPIETLVKVRSKLGDAIKPGRRL